MTRVPNVGDELEPLVRTVGFAHWNRFAAVNDEFIPIHTDDEASRAAGQAGAIGMGNLQFSYLHTLLRNWLGPDGEIRSVSCQFRSVTTKGTVVTARGRVREVDDSVAPVIVHLDVWTEDHQGKIVTPGEATVSLTES